MDPVFFESPQDLRKWFEQNFDTAQELWVGYYRKETGKSGITWSQSVDEALCFGWIDGIRKKIDDFSYTNRFTKRRAKSNWSAVNIKKVEELTKQGLMHQAGLAAFQKWQEENSNGYSSEQGNPVLSAEYEEKIKASPTAWAFFQSHSPSHRKRAIGWVMSAKQEETRLKRLDKLIKEFEAGRKL